MPTRSLSHRCASDRGRRSDACSPESTSAVAVLAHAVTRTDHRFRRAWDHNGPTHLLPACHLLLRSRSRRLPCSFLHPRFSDPLGVTIAGARVLDEQVIFGDNSSQPIPEGAYITLNSNFSRPITSNDIVTPASSPDNASLAVSLPPPGRSSYSVYFCLPFV